MVQSTVEFRDGDTNVIIPIGTTSSFLSFDDGLRTLRFEPGTREVLFSDQVVDETFVPATGAVELIDILDPSPDADSRLILFPEGRATAGGRLNVTGTNSEEVLFIEDGSFAVFDPSFNRGGDTIDLPGSSGNYFASLESSSVRIESASTTALVPIGPAGTTLSFDNQDLMLFFDTNSGEAMIGATVVDASPGPF